MGIKISTSDSSVSLYIKSAMDILYSEIMLCLNRLGLECITRVRDRSSEESWFDQTGNLRSSVGYAIYTHGKKIIESAFDAVGKGSEGSSEGKKLVAELAKEYSQTYALVIVAAMNYAEYVERMKNKDVLASTDLWARDKIDGVIKIAVKRATAKINALKL